LRPQECGSEAFATLVNLIRQSEDRKVQFAAVREVLSRGYGPPKTVKEVVEDGDGTIDEAQVIAFLCLGEARRRSGCRQSPRVGGGAPGPLQLTVKIEVVGERCLHCSGESPEGQPILLPRDE
jgi:hypothetical protein